MLSKQYEVKRSEAIVTQSIAAWLERLAELHARNAAVEKDDERLPDSDFIIDLALQAELHEEGGRRAAAVSVHAERAMVAHDVVRGRVRQLCLLSQVDPPQELLSLREHTFVSTLTPDDTKRWKDVGAVIKVPGVASYAVRRLPADEARRRRQVRFLRQVEQEEWEGRPQEARGTAFTLRRYQGLMAGRYSVANSEGECQPGGINLAFITLLIRQKY